MKRILMVVLAAVLCVGLVACAGTQGADEVDIDELASAAAELEEAVGGDEEEASEEPAEEASAEPTEGAEEETSGDVDVFGNGSIEGLKADKIVSVSPSGTEIICALGAEDRLVGRDEYSNYPESVQDVEVVGDFNGPDVEKVVALEPDVVLMSDKLQQDAIDQLEDLGVPVVLVDATSLEDIPYSFELIGKLVGEEEAAQALADELAQAIADAQANQPEEAKTVYYAMSYGDAGNWTSGPGSFIYDMIKIAGGTPVPDDESLPTWVEYPVEDLVAADPDIILTDSSMGAVDPIEDQTGYSDLTAVAEGNVHEISADVFSRPGPRIIDAIKTLSDILNG
ncbi:ABC transporter substrate-binding protein [Christensenellaceae bacterium OttesenSCG-928-K19]|nr:ABC transporter substrate-binding protein [Christensenellaceae bacterium OttesenSCG-928-K19]